MLDPYDRLSWPMNPCHLPAATSSAGPVGCFESRVAVHSPTNATSMHWPLPLLRELFRQSAPDRSTLFIGSPSLHLSSLAASAMSAAESLGLSATATSVSKTA